MFENISISAEILESNLPLEKNSFVSTPSKSKRGWKVRADNWIRTYLCVASKVSTLLLNRRKDFFPIFFTRLFSKLNYRWISAVVDWTFVLLSSESWYEGSYKGLLGWAFKAKWSSIKWALALVLIDEATLNKHGTFSCSSFLQLHATQLLSHVYRWQSIPPLIQSI